MLTNLFLIFTDYLLKYQLSFCDRIAGVYQARTYGAPNYNFCYAMAGGLNREDLVANNRDFMLSADIFEVDGTRLLKCLLTSKKTAMFKDLEYNYSLAFEYESALFKCLQLTPLLMITYAEVLAKIIATLSGRPAGTEIHPEDHEDTEIMILDYIEQLKTAVQGAPISNLLLTGSPGSNLTATGVKIILTASANFVFGDIGYIKSDGTIGLPKADAIATASALFMCADATINIATSENWLVLGIARNDAWNWTVGQTIFLSTVFGAGCYSFAADKRFP